MPGQLQDPADKEEDPEPWTGLYPRQTPAPQAHHQNDLMTIVVRGRGFGGQGGRDGERERRMNEATD